MAAPKSRVLRFRPPGSLCLAIALVMWLRDARRVLRGTMSLRAEDAVFYSAVRLVSSAVCPA